METTVDGICFDHDGTVVSTWISREILQGTTYPHLAFVDDVRVILDVGANCGATAVYFASLYPDAQVHAFEPGSTALGYLRLNAARYDNVAVHPFGLFSADTELLLYQTEDALVMGSIHPHGPEDESETVQLRDAGSWAAEHGVDRVDILKVDVEGAEVEVLSSLAALLPSVKVLYLEYHSRAMRRAVAQLVEPTHEFYSGGWMALDQGECIYLRSDLCDVPGAAERLDDLYRERRRG